MEILKKTNIIHKEFEKEKRSYYLFKDFEVIITELNPGDEQEKHYHNKILEVYYIVSGAIDFFVQINGEEKFLLLKKGDLIILEPKEIHSLKNRTKNKAIAITFKKIYEKSDYSEIFKTDKFIK